MLQQLVSLGALEFQIGPFDAIVKWMSVVVQFGSSVTVR